MGPFGSQNDEMYFLQEKGNKVKMLLIGGFVRKCWLLNPFEQQNIGKQTGTIIAARTMRYFFVGRSNWEFISNKLRVNHKKKY